MPQAQGCHGRQGQDTLGRGGAELEVVVDAVRLHSPDDAIMIHNPVDTIRRQLGELNAMSFMFHLHSCFVDNLNGGVVKVLELLRSKWSGQGP